MSIDLNEGYDGTWWDDLCNRKYTRYYVCVVSEESRKAQEATRKKKEAAPSEKKEAPGRSTSKDKEAKRSMCAFIVGTGKICSSERECLDT